MNKTIQTVVMATLCLIFKAEAQEPVKPPSLKNEVLIGKVISAATGESLPGALIKVTTTNQTIVSNDMGDFVLNLSNGSYNLSAHYLNYKTKYVTIQIPLKEKLIVSLENDDNRLDEVQIVGYGKTTRRLNTGSVSSITAKEIENQPVTNVLSALSGRMPGVFVQTTNGLPGGNVNIQIRGKGSIAAGTDPLYIIDGVPFVGNSLVYNTALADGITGAISPLNSISPTDIENITVLKDADATAIYGSRGANGVILITTKKGKAGKIKTTIDVSSGLSKVSNTPNLLGLKDYLAIRTEAFKNDGISPSSDPISQGYAPDLMVWDQTKSTDWAKYYMEGTAHMTSSNASISGGGEQVQFLIGGNYKDEGSVLKGDNRYKRGGMQLNMQYNSVNQKFKLSASLSYLQDDNKTVNPSASFANIVLLPPNFPIYTQDGQLNWVTGYNPVAALNNKSKTTTENILSNTNIAYTLYKGMDFKVNIGLNNLSMNQVLINPKAGQNPASTGVSNTYFGTSSSKSMIVEPQLTYSLLHNKSKVNFLIGGTWQQSNKGLEMLRVSNFSSEQMLENLAAATTITPSISSLQYKYVSLFGRVTYSIKDKYLLNGSVRRDGSSRFSVSNQFGNFGALGAAWIFSSEKWIKDHLKFITYAKVRASYGVTGNDQIPDYQYLSTYSASGNLYQDISGLRPSRVENSKFKWESNKKLELGLDLNLFSDRLNFTLNRYQNKSGNQLINYSLPYLTGFESYQANLPAVIKNTGWEIEINSSNIHTENFSWTTGLNITATKNRLVSFPGLSTSSYSNSLIIGESTLRAYGYRSLVADPETGAQLYVNKTGGTTSTPAFENLFTTIGDKNPEYFGGLANSFTYKKFQIEVFMQFARQYLTGGLISPGTLSNNYRLVIDRWQNKGDITNVPKASTRFSSYYSQSSANFFDASYVRLKNVSLSYVFPKKWVQEAKLTQVKVYCHAQNLATWWNKNTALYDPESGAGINIPPLKVFIIGLQVSL